MMGEVLTALAPDLWAAARPLKIAVGDIGTRMTVARLSDGGLWLHSPVRPDDETRRALDAVGPVRAVVAPTAVHHFFAGDYRALYPQSLLFGAPGLERKRADLRFDAILGDEAPELWRADLEQHLFRGSPTMNEVVFFHRASRTLMLTDLAFNVAADQTAGARLFHWVVGSAGRFGPHRLVRFFMRDRKAARASVERILQWDFDRITVTHGQVLEHGGRERFAQAFAFL